MSGVQEMTRRLPRRAVLLLPVVLAVRTPCPMAVLSVPVVFLLSAYEPTTVL